MRVYNLFWGLLALPAPAIAQVDSDTQAWLTLGASGSLSGPLQANLESVIRASDDQNRIYEVEMTGMLGYKLSKVATLWGGYTRVLGYRGALPTTIENRLREQLTTRWGGILGGTLSTRSLLEQRSRENARGLGWRLREQVKFALPIRKGAKTTLVASHESFIGLNSTPWGQQSGYQRMRNFAGVGVGLAKTVRAEIGYLNEYDFRRNRPDRTAHVASLSLGYSF